MSSLTHDETLAAALCALRYPAGWGESYIAHTGVSEPTIAAMLLAINPNRVQYG